MKIASQTIPASAGRPVFTVGRSKFPRLLALVVTLGWALAGVVQGQEVVTFDFPAKERPAILPAGLRDWPLETTDGLSTIEVPLLPLNDEGALLVTVVFEDAEGRIIHARWTGEDQTSTTLAENLSENLKGWNERTFEVPYDLLQQPGSLFLETDAEVQPVKRVALAWTWPAGVLMSPSARTVRFLASAGRPLTEQDVSTQAAGPLPDVWSAGIWKAFLQEKIESLDEALQFTVPIEAVPGVAVFRAKVLGIPLDGSFSLWVNGHKIGPLVFEIPELAAAGYYKADGGDLRYAGWRNGAAVIPVSFLQAGDNAIVLQAEKGAYIKDALLELNFEKEGSPLTLDAAAGAEVPSPAADLVPPGKKAAAGPTVVVVPPEPLTGGN
ncbi:MAG: hypothetical protein ACOYMS_03460 [Terrimicrobiaceae bacterium]